MRGAQLPWSAVDAPADDTWVALTADALPAEDRRADALNEGVAQAMQPPLHVIDSAESGTWIEMGTNE